MRRALPLIIVSLLVLVAGCGGSSEETTSSTPVGGENSVQDVRSEWEASADCKRPKGASRWGCSVGDYRCQGVVVDRGWTISCVQQGSSIVFRAGPD